MVTLIAKEVVFYSPHDENAFFEWINRISCIEEPRGVGSELHLKVRPPSDAQLRELIALFCRYHISSRQLAQFETTENAAWFRHNDKAYWHVEIFGSE
jgi:hypothetical protein